MPKYLQITCGFDVKGIGMFARAPFVDAAVGSVMGGLMTGRWIKSGTSVDATRKRAIWMRGLMMFIVLLATIYLADNPTKFVIIVAFVLFGFQLPYQTYKPSQVICSVGNQKGHWQVLGGTAGIFSVIIMDFLIPVITKVSYTPAFIFIAVFLRLGVLSVYRLVKVIGPVKKIK